MPIRPSLTAEMVALARARDALEPPERRVVGDAFAGRFLEAGGSRLTAAGGADGTIAGAAELGLRLPFVGITAMVLARHRLMDDLLLAETAAGASQCVILGAGYDSRAYRFPPPRGPARWFEVDHPTLSSRKREIAARVAGGGAAPAHVTYVPVDFVRERLAERLLAEGFDPAARTVFIWEGVTYYLPADAVRGTLATVRSIGAPGSTIVFDAWTRLPGVRGALLDGARTAAGVLGILISEPFLFVLDSPDAGAAILREAGFDVLFVHGPEPLGAILKANGRALLHVPSNMVVCGGRVGAGSAG